MTGLRKRKVPQAFQQPFNNLTDGGPVKKNKHPIHSPARRSQGDQTVIKSDKNLLLSLHDTPRKRSLSPETPEDDLWSLPQDNNIPVHKLRLAKAYEEKYDAFSDSDSNDLPKYIGETIALYDLKLDNFQQEKQITSILTPLISLIGVREEDVFKSGLITYKMKLLRSLENLEVYGEPTDTDDDDAIMLHINPLRDIEEISASQQSILIKTSQRFKFNDKSQNRIILELSTKNLDKFKSLWALLITEQKSPHLAISEKLESEILMELKTSRMSVLASSSLRSSAAKFLNKSLSSLQPPGRQGRRKPTPSTVDPTPIRSTDFYTPTNTIPSALIAMPNPAPKSTLPSTNASPPPSGRKLRSKPTAEHIIIDDFDLTTPKKPLKREKFGPSLTHIFADKTQFEIKESDYQCLQGSQWVNDVIIDFFMKYYMEEAINDSKLEVSDAHVLTTFFMYKLKSSENHYENIARWVSKLDLLNKKFVVLPVNESLHWFGLIINNLNSILDQPEGEGMITIYVFDSLKQTHENLLTPLRNFIIGYAKDKYGKTVTPAQIKLITAKVAKQPNFNDCGVHVIFNVMRFFENRTACLNLWNQTAVNPREQNECFPKKRRDKMRDQMRGILKALQNMQQSQMGEVGTPEPSDDSSIINKNKNDAESEDEIFCIDAEEFQRSNDGSRDRSENEINEENMQSDQKINKGDAEGGERTLEDEDSALSKVDRLSDDVHKIDIDQTEQTERTLISQDDNYDQDIEGNDTGNKSEHLPRVKKSSKTTKLEDLFSEEETKGIDFSSRLRAAKGTARAKEPLAEKDDTQPIVDSVAALHEIKSEVQVHASQESISSEFEYVKGSQGSKPEILSSSTNDVHIYTQSDDGNDDISQIRLPDIKISSEKSFSNDGHEGGYLSEATANTKGNEHFDKELNSKKPLILRFPGKLTRKRLSRGDNILKDVSQKRIMGNGLINGEALKSKNIVQKIIPFMTAIDNSSSRNTLIQGNLDDESEKTGKQNRPKLSRRQSTNDQEVHMDDLSNRNQVDDDFGSHTEVIDDDFEITNISSSPEKADSLESSTRPAITKDQFASSSIGSIEETNLSTRAVLQKLSRAQSSVGDHEMHGTAESDVEDVTDNFISKSTTSFEL